MKCSTCKEEKENTEFWKRKERKLGNVYTCKKCMSIRRNIQREKNKEEINKKRKEYYNKNKERLIKLQEKYNKKVYENNPKIIARRRLNDALKLGKIKKHECCQVCGCKDKVLEGHHSNYDDHLSVIWVCSLCHKKFHRKTIGKTCK